MKANHMFSVINLLIKHPRITAAAIAEKLEVSKRTVYRDIEALNMAGIPVVSFPGYQGGLGILDGFKYPDRFFSSEEMEKVIVGLKALQSIESENKINILIEKLTPDNHIELFRSSDTMIDLSSWFTDSVLKKDLAILKKAIQQKQLIEIQYQAD